MSFGVGCGIQRWPDEMVRSCQPHSRWADGRFHNRELIGAVLPAIGRSRACIPGMSNKGLLHRQRCGMDEAKRYPSIFSMKAKDFRKRRVSQRPQPIPRATSTPIRSSSAGMTCFPLFARQDAHTAQDGMPSEDGTNSVGQRNHVPLSADQAADRERRDHSSKPMRPRRASPNGTSERSSTRPPKYRASGSHTTSRGSPTAFR